MPQGSFRCAPSHVSVYVRADELGPSSGRQSPSGPPASCATVTCGRRAVRRDERDRQHRRPVLAPRRGRQRSVEVVADAGVHPRLRGGAVQRQVSHSKDSQSWIVLVRELTEPTLRKGERTRCERQARSQSRLDNRALSGSVSSDAAARVHHDPLIARTRRHRSCASLAALRVRDRGHPRCCSGAVPRPSGPG